MFEVEQLIGRINLRIFMTRLHLFRCALALLVLGLLASCAEMDTPARSVTNAPVAPTPVPGYWNGDGVSGAAKIVVSLKEQRAYFFKGKTLVGETTISSGKPGFSTPAGQYRVVWKDAEHISTVFGDYVDALGNVTKSNIDVRKDSKPPGSHYDGARMPFAMFFRGGYAMHQGYVPPYAASHGCIRVPAGMAETFFNAAELGTPVIVKEEAVMHSVPPAPLVPALAVVAPPAPNLVRSPAPAFVRSTVPARPTVPVRSTISAPTPIPVRSPARVLSRAPASAPSPSPIVLRAPSPAPVLTRGPAFVPPAPTPVLSRAPATVRSAPTPIFSPGPASVRPAPTPVLSRGPVSVRPTPTPVVSRTPGPVRSRTLRRSPAPSPTPTPTR